jgi:hypothetical protein
VTLGLGRTPLDVQPLEDDAAWNRLVGALRQQESGGGKPLVSKKGALGSLQLMPGTADDMLKALGRRDVLALPAQERYRRVRFDRDLNEQLGQEYLRRQMKDFGHPALALAAYNAGPGNVRKWVRTHGDPRKGEIDLAAWVDKIPFAETRSYVRKVTADAGLPLKNSPAPVAMPVGQAPVPVSPPTYRTPQPSYENDEALVADGGQLVVGPTRGEPTAQDWLARLLGRSDEPAPIDVLIRLLSSRA